LAPLKLISEALGKMDHFWDHNLGVSENGVCQHLQLFELEK
jgi:hypothetical protein